MISHENMLAIMKGCGPQNPMPMSEIVKRSGLDLDSCEVILQQMYQALPSAVNRAEITRYDVKQIYYWPTGMVDTAKWREMTISPKKRPTFETPRRDQIKPTAEVNKMPTDKAVQKKKTQSLTILEYIEKHPGCTVKQTCIDLKNSNILAFIKPYISANFVIVTGDKGQKTLKLKPGLKVADFYRGDKRGNSPTSSVAAAQQERMAKPAVHLEKPVGMAETAPGSEQENEPKAGNTSEAPTAQPTSLDPESTQTDIPAFLLKENSKSDRVAPIREATKPIADADIRMAAELNLPETYPVIKAATPPRLLLSVSSDLTLTISGKSAEPIELSVEESLQLFDFIDGIQRLWRPA